MAATVGIIANPVSARDIRRVIANATSLQITDRANIVLRVLTCLKAAGVGDKVRFVEADLFQQDLSEATVITLYLLPSLNLKLRPTLWKLKPGTRIVSHSFDMGDWKPEATETIDGRTIYFWTVGKGH